MKDRLITLLGGLLALLLCAIILFPDRFQPEPEFSKPTSLDTDGAGLAGLARWLRASDVPSLSLRLPYDRLTTMAELPERGNLLIVSLPPAMGFRSGELDHLRSWVQQGNSLLVLGAMADSPDWSEHNNSEQYAEPYRFLEQFELTLEASEPYLADHDSAADADESSANVGARLEQLTDLDRHAETLLVPSLDHPLLQDLRHTATRVDGWDDQYWQLTGSSGRLVLPLLEFRRGGPPAGRFGFWEVRDGEGRLWLSATSDLFSNSRLAVADNAKLFAALAARALEPDSLVIFDDFHQGLSDLYDPDAFYSDPRLHNSLWFLLALWLLYLLGRDNRLGPLRAKPKIYQAGQLVESLAGLLQQRLARPEAAQALFRHWFDAVRARHQLPTNGKPVWELLEREHTDHAQLRRLRTLYRQVGQGRRTDLAKLIQLIKTSKEPPT